MLLTYKAKLVAVKKDFAGYHHLIFKELDDAQRYIFCKCLPNWDEPIPNFNRTGYLTLEHASAGDRINDTRSYKKDGVYYQCFTYENRTAKASDIQVD